MKNTLIISVVILLFAFHSSAQKIRFTDKRNYWFTQGDGVECNFFTRGYHYGSDTIIHGITYQPMICGSNSNPSNCTGFDFEDLSGFYFREDTVAAKVYYICFNSSYSDTQEHVLFDYNMNVGDTIRYVHTGTYSLDSVAGIDSTIISGVSHKIIYLQNMQGYGSAYYTIVEGLGCVNSTFLPAFFVACFEYEEKLVCFSQDTTYPPITVPVNNLCVGTITDTFSNSYGCAHLSVQKINNPLATYAIYPNPAFSSLTIAASEKISTITVTNLLGQTVYTQKCNTQQVEVNVTNLPKGIYFVKVNGTEVRKFVKE